MALVFIVFDVEIALLYPWAVVLREMGTPAFWAFLVFFLLIAIPFCIEQPCRLLPPSVVL